MKKAKLIHLTPEAIAYWTEIAKANGSTFKTFIQIILEEKPKLKAKYEGTAYMAMV